MDELTVRKIIALFKKNISEIVGLYDTINEEMNEKISEDLILMKRIEKSVTIEDPKITLDDESKKIFYKEILMVFYGYTFFNDFDVKTITKKTIDTFAAQKTKITFESNTDFALLALSLGAFYKHKKEKQDDFFVRCSSEKPAPHRCGNVLHGKTK